MDELNDDDDDDDECNLNVYVCSNQANQAVQDNSAERSQTVSGSPLIVINYTLLLMV